jgi:hypothetical protein
MKWSVSSELLVVLVLVLVGQLAEHEFGLGGRAVFAGDVILLNDFQRALNRVAVSGVPANFEFVGQPVEETGGGNIVRGVGCSTDFLAPKHAG